MHYLCTYICKIRIMKKFMIQLTALMLCMVAVFTSCNEKKSGYPYETNYLPVQLPGSQKWSILDVNSGELLVKDAYAEVPSPVIDDMFYVMTEDGTYNYYNVAAPTTPVNAEPYGSVTVFSEDGLAVASKRGGSLCVINKKCEVVKELPKDVAQCSMFSRGMAAYQNDLGLWGYIDVKGDTVIAAKYATANLFVNDDYAIVVDENLMNDTTMSYSVINKKGEVMFDANTAQYRLVQPYFIDGVLPVIKGDTIVCLNSKGEETANPNKSYDAVDKAGYKTFSRTPGGNFIVLTKDDKMGVVDYDNKTIIEAKHERLTDLRKDRYIVGQDSLFHLIDGSGNPVGNVKFVHAHGGSEALYATRGFIDTNLAAASMLMMVGSDNCAGATAGTTLQDMVGMLNPNPAGSVGQNGIAIPQGPFIVRFMFDKEMASVINDVPCYNMDARIMCVDVSLNAINCGLDTEEQIVSKVSSAMGTKGFILDRDNIFVNDQHQAISMGYNHGIVSLCFFMDASQAQAMPREPRK